MFTELKFKWDYLKNMNYNKVLKHNILIERLKVQHMVVRCLGFGPFSMVWCAAITMVGYPDIRCDLIEFNDFVCLLRQLQCNTCDTITMVFIKQVGVLYLKTRGNWPRKHPIRTKKTRGLGILLFNFRLFSAQFPVKIPVKDVFQLKISPTWRWANVCTPRFRITPDPIGWSTTSSK